MTSINRRTALTAIAALSATAGATAAFALPADNPEAELIRLGAELDRELALERELGTVSKRYYGIFTALLEERGLADAPAKQQVALMKECGYTEAAEPWGDCHKRLHDLAERIDVIPAVTVAGFAVKANAIMFDMFLCEGDEAEHDVKAMRKLIAAMRSAGAVS